jgi:hypothetical protein
MRRSGTKNGEALSIGVLSEETAATKIKCTRPEVFMLSSKEVIQEMRGMEEPDRG